ncbi:GC-rich sequence DNA-binding factor 2 isoform X2 [Conger conger]|uniref:GC-rich sequence DNA-binding factor 2 isoform X2 n=1 Tax=Conger conger TaxID=82655 RepID=UPI002A5A82FD|nr:GC-rich sequence DNA-binding factor 2 isoform X2 [Conger conger]
MFIKKPRRNFRTRRDESSEEDEQKSNEGEEKRVKAAPVLRRSKLPQSRGISCTSKPEVVSDKSPPRTAEDADDTNEGDTHGKPLQLADKEENLINDMSLSDKNEGAVPDPQQIYAAVKQRRAARAQREYLPLEPGQEQGSERDSDDDDDDDDDDHDQQIQFAPKLKTLRQRIAEEMRDSEDDGMGSQGDEDQTLWEEQQIRKGVKMFKETVRATKKCDIPASLPQISIDIVKKRVSAKLGALGQVHRGRAMELRRIQQEMESARAALDQLENGSPQEQHSFYKRMRLYSQNLLQCLGEKVVEINAVELDMCTLLSDQAEALLGRRREAVREESTHLQLQAYKTEGGHAHNAQLEVLGQRSGCVDEGLPKGDQPLPEEDAELYRRRDEILKEAENIFVDVHEDFSDVRNILSKFEEWRVLFPESYDNAYISLCLPKLLTPVIRHQLIGWNPLNPDCEDIAAHPWYPAVEKFCRRQGGEDLTVLKSIIERTIVPKIQGFVELVWDPLSMEQSRCLVSVCQNLQDDYLIFSGNQSKPAKALLEAVAVRMRSAVDVDVFIPLYPAKFLDDASSLQFQFQDKQFCSAVKLLHNITLWHGLVPEDVLIELGLNRLLSRYLMITLRNAPCGEHAVEKCKKVAACFPKSWFEHVSCCPSIPELQIFSKHLLQTAHALCKSPHASTRDTVSELLILLRNMKALDSVTEIVEKYHFEGF